MYNPNDIITLIKNQFNAENEVLMIELEHNKPKPIKDVFLAITFDTLANSQELRGAETYQMIDGGYTKRRRSDTNLNLSVTSYSKKQKSIASKAITDAYEWFRFYHYEKLAESGIIVVDIEDISDQSIILIDQYEFRYSFDMTIRVESVAEKPADEMASVEMSVNDTDININLEGE